MKKSGLGSGLRLALRSRIQARRRFNVEPAGDGAFRYTCTTCQTAYEQTPKDALGRYRSRDGAVGICWKCTEDERQRRFPV